MRYPKDDLTVEVGMTAREQAKALDSMCDGLERREPEFRCEPPGEVVSAKGLEKLYFTFGAAAVLALLWAMDGGKDFLLSVFKGFTGGVR